MKEIIVTQMDKLPKGTSNKHTDKQYQNNFCLFFIITINW